MNWGKGRRRKTKEANQEWHWSLPSSNLPSVWTFCPKPRQTHTDTYPYGQEKWTVPDLVLFYQPKDNTRNFCASIPALLLGCRCFIQSKIGHWQLFSSNLCWQCKYKNDTSRCDELIIKLEWVVLWTAIISFWRCSL